MTPNILVVDTSHNVIYNRVVIGTVISGHLGEPVLRSVQSENLEALSAVACRLGEPGISWCVVGEQTAQVGLSTQLGSVGVGGHSENLGRVVA